MSPPQENRIRFLGMTAGFPGTTGITEIGRRGRAPPVPAHGKINGPPGVATEIYGDPGVRVAVVLSRRRRHLQRRRSIHVQSRMPLVRSNSNY